MPLTLWNEDATKTIEALRLSYEERLQSFLSDNVTLELDGSEFLAHSAFQSKDDSEKQKLMEGLLNSFVDGGLFADTDGLKAWLEKSERAKAKVSEEIKTVVVSFAADNSVDSKTGNSYYQIRQETDQLQAKVRLDCIGYTDGWGPKVDKQMSLNVNAEIAQTKAESIREAQEQKLNEAVGAELELVIDWSFMDSSEFQKLDDSARDSMILGLVQDVSEKGLFDSEGGFVSWCKKSPRVQQHILTQIDGIDVSLDPRNSVDTKIGNSYYQIRLEQRRLAVKVRMDCVSYTDGWGEKTDLHLNSLWLEEEAMAQCTKSLAARLDQFNEAIGAEIQCEINWSSFLESEEFRKLDKSARRSTIINLSDSIVQLGLLGDNGLKAWCEQSSRGRHKFLETISLIRIELDPKNNVDTQTGNSYYQIRVDGPVLIVRTRLDCVSYTDGWGEKVDRQLSVNAGGEMAIRQAEEKLAAFNERLRSETNQDLEVVVDWSSFCLPEKDQTKELQQIVDHVVEKGLFGEGGAVQYFQGETQAADHVKYLLVSFEPNNSVDSKTGNGYYQIRIVDGFVQVLVRADCVGYTDGWLEKLTFHSESLLAATRKEESPIEVFEYLRPLPDPIPAPMADLLEQHCLLGEYEEFQSRDLTPEELAAREERKRQAQLRKEQAEQKAKEAEAARREEAARQAEKLRAAQEKMRAALGQQGVASDTPYDIDTTAPEIEGVERLLAELKERNGQWTSAIGCQTSFEVDWSFKDHRFFKELGASEQSAFLETLRRRVLASFLDSGSGLAAITQSDELYKNWAMAFAARVIVAVDGDNSISCGVSSQSSEYFQLTMPSSGTLVLTINANKVDEGLYNLSEHVKVIANVENMIEMREISEFANQQSNDLSKATGTIISTEIDFDFIFSPEFQEQAGEIRVFSEIKKQRETIGQLKRVLSFLASSSESIGQRCLADDIMKSAVAEKISAIHVSVDPKSQIDDRTLGDEYSKAYSMTLDSDSKTLSFTCNLNLLDTPYRFEKRFDEIIQVRVQQAQRDCLEALSELLDSKQTALGRRFECEIDWSFVDHEAFKSKTLDEQRDLIREIDKRWLGELLSERGLANKDSVMQSAMRERIESARFILDPEEQVNCPVGGSYAVHYKLGLQGKVLTVHYNLNNENHLYNLNEKFDDLLDVRVAQSQLAAEEELNELRKKLEDAVGKKIEVEALWQSFTGDPTFLALDLKERGELTRLLITKNAAALLGEGLSLSQLAKSDPSSKTIIQEKVEGITVAVDCNDTINDPEDGEYANHYSIDFVEGWLKLVVNLGKIREGLYRLDEKLDRVLHFETAKQVRLGQETMIPDLIAQVQAGPIGTELGFRVDLNFTESATWQSYKISEKSSAIQGLFASLKMLVEDGETGLSGALAEDESALEKFKRHVEIIDIGYDMEIESDEVPTDWYDAEDYRLTLSNPGVLSVRASPSIRRGHLSSFHRKLLPQLHFAEQRRVTYGRDWQFATQKCEEILGQACEVSFDWSSLEQGAFLYKQDISAQERRIQRLHRAKEGAIGAFRKLIKAIASNPASLKTFVGNITAIRFAIHPNGENYPVEIEDGELLLGLPMEDVEEAVPFKTWLMMIEWKLQSLIAANQFRATRRIQKFERDCAELLGKEVPVTIDWTDFETPTYLERGPEQIVRDFDCLSGALMKAVLIEGLAAVAEHPLGKTTIQNEVDGVHVVYRQEMTYTGWSQGRSDSQVEIMDRQLLISTQDLLAASQGRYKPRIEFCLDLIVKIAAANSKPKRDAVQSELTEALGQALALEVNLDFSRSDEFKGQTPEDQADLVTLLASSWFQDVLNQDVGLRGLIRHEIGENFFKDHVQTVVLTAATSDKSIPEAGIFQWQPEQNSISLTIPFHFHLDRLQSPRTYARIADCLNIDLAIAQVEAAELLSSTQAELNAKFQRDIPIVLDWESWVNDSEWLAIPADDRQLFTHKLATGMRKALLGYEGLVGPTEFTATREAMLAAFNEIRVVVDLTEDHEGKVGHQDQTLTVHVSLSQMQSDKFRGLRLDVERQLQLKPLMETAAREEVDEKVGKLQLSIPAKLQIDWSHLLAQPEYQGESDFVALIREVGSLPKIAFQGEEGLDWLRSENQSCAEKLNQLTEIRFCVDLSNTVRPPQVRFVPMFYCCELEQQKLTVEMKRNPDSDRGCGQVLEFQLDAVEAERKEEAQIQRIAERRRSDEIRRRERERRDIQNDNKMAQESYAAEVRRYKTRFKEYEKKKVRPHRICDGTGKKTCGNMWHDGRSKKRRCDTCRGKGWIRCVGCSGTGLHYPRIQPPDQPNPPVDRTIPDWEPIESIDWRAGI